MEVDQIMRKITVGLSGEQKKDIRLIMHSHIYVYV